ncbi:gag-pol polyprotein [Plasmopara halstedii]|uniref:Gag-pol polyprotein n=1 Tax=Plasmopara halstedii TaxID=4781 RepID=A0A0P1ALS5_PLAHL|nr:gag-pol polyprotein [Plasmopara halstedii]CEG41938.1 gag-pol polyprotein [Plasmopara halstedii]|eukprot:XP_024578307.1 gag-pol polyprotein [Plasmopara halstedii]
MKYSDAHEWAKACESEKESLNKNKTWDLVPLPEGRKAIGNRWVFWVKENQDGEDERYKARLVVKGFAHKYGIGYEETFAPVAKFASSKVLLSLSAIYDLTVHLMNVKMAFLNGLLEEDIFLVQPDGYVDISHPNDVCKLKKSLYGIKQSPTMVNQMIDDFMLQLDLKKCETGHCVFTKRTVLEMIFVALYVNFQASSRHGLQGYSDADWAGDIESRRSTSGYAFMMSGGVISWRSKKQRTVTFSSIEAEYIALLKATQEANLLKTFLWNAMYWKQAMQSNF